MPLFKENLEKMIREQEDWIKRHGRNLIGYLVYYGSKNDPGHYGDGAEQIYAADVAELERLKGMRRKHEAY